MKLLIDMGNSWLKWAILCGDQLTSTQGLPHQVNDFEARLSQAWRLLTHPPTQVWISNVAGTQKAEMLTQWISQHWHLQPHFVTTSYQQCGITNGYENFTQLGVDRWLAMIGAYHIENQKNNFKKNSICVVDCGTAVTLDLLTNDGHHLGGLIMPGMTTMYNALLKNAEVLKPLTKTVSKFSDLSKGSGKKLLGNNTQTGIDLGICYAIIGGIEHALNQFEDKKRNQLTLVITGGNALPILSLLSIPYHYIPDLVLQGLVVVINQSS